MDYYKALYAARKSMQQCVQCGKQDAFTLNGHTYCADCTEWRREYYQKKKPEVLKRTHEYKAARTRTLREKGICTTCGKRKVTPPYATCDRCRAKSRGKDRAKREWYMNDTTLCSKCHKRPHLEGKKMCAECAESFKRVQELGAAARHRRRRNGAMVCD